MLLSKGQYRELSVDKAQRLLSSHNIGCPPAPLRILPKKTGIRAIAMLSKTCEGNNDANKRSNFSPPNKVMQSTFHALKYEHEKKPALFGAGVLGLTEVFPSFCSFVGALKQLSGTSRELFFTSADIKHCYDTINQNRLYKLMRSMIEEEMYLTKDKFILCSKGDNAVRCIWKKKTCPPEHFSCSSPSEFAGQYTHAIFVDGVNCSAESCKTINGLLRDHIFGQVVIAKGNFGPRYLHQKNGIPQGSILSSMFCNTYFGSLEEVLFDDVFDEAVSHVIRGNSSDNCDSILVKNLNSLHILLRIVDDFLLISTDKNASIRFLEKLNNGIPSLGVRVNRDKTRVNYSITGGRKCENQSFFPWCGLLIHTTTCEITLDYERFYGQKAIETVSVHRIGSEGTNLRKAMKGFVRPRCNQQLLFSSHINSIEIVRLNFYQTMLLCAIKTTYYIESSGMGLSSKKQHNFIYNSACDTIRYAFLLISSKLKHDFHLRWTDALWIGKHAFCSVFRRKKYENMKQLFVSSRKLQGSNREDLFNVTKRAEKLFNLKSD
jgi:telomerase reverse transcriptase